MKKLLPLLAVVLMTALCLASCSFLNLGGKNPDGGNDGGGSSNGGNSSENQTPDDGNQNGENQGGNQSSENQEENKPACNQVTVVDQAKAATCTEDGLTAGAHCSTCNEILVKQ